MAEYGQIIVKDFLEHKRFVLNKIPESDEKTPDFVVYKEEKIVFYCEEKTLDYDDFEGSKKDSTYNVISKHLHTAVKQFNSINPKHEIPNVMAIVNLDTPKDIHDLFISLTGYALLDSGKYMKIHKVGHRTVEDISQVDLFLWFNNGEFINYLWKDDEGKEVRRSLEILFNDTQEKEKGEDIT